MIKSYVRQSSAPPPVPCKPSAAGLHLRLLMNLSDIFVLGLPTARSPAADMELTTNTYLRPLLNGCYCEEVGKLISRSESSNGCMCY